MGGLAALKLNAANEIAVAAFLAGRIKLPDIYAVVDKMVAENMSITEMTLPPDYLRQTVRCANGQKQLIASETFTGEEKVR